MTVYPVTIKDDDRHPDGGLAVILFHGLHDIPDHATVSIEAIDPALQPLLPNVIEPGSMRFSEEGLEIAIGSAAARIDAGTGVSIAFGPYVSAEALWPTLTPLPAVSRSRGRVAQAGKRRVVSPAAVRGAPRLPMADPLKLQSEPGPSKPTAVSDDLETIKPVEVTEPEPKRPEIEPDLVPPKINRPGLDDAVTLVKHQELKQGLRRQTVVALACSAFVTGVGLTAAVEALLPRPPQPASPSKPVMSDLKPSSPYEALSALPMMSPRGQAVVLREQGQFLPRALALRASDPPESEFWLQWAVRSLASEGQTAARLSALGIFIARGQETPGALAAARTLWEIAALSGDCGALKNLATSHATADGTVLDAPEAAIWRNRQGKC